MKITRYFAMLAAVVGLSSACQELEQVVFNPETVVAPELNAVADIDITIDNLSTGNVEFTWKAADFGVATQIYYSLDMSAPVDGKTKTINLFKNVSGTKNAVSYESLNGKLLYDFNFAANTPGEVSFTLYASLKSGEAYPSNVVTANATAAVAERTYPTVWVIGDYCGWKHDNTQFLYDFAGADDVYSGVVDFGEKAANGFKITGIAGWQDDCNWGEETKAEAADEPSSVQLISGGGSQDIKRYAKRFYVFTFSKSTLELKKNLSFDKVAVIGLNGDWNNDIEMNFNAAAQKQVFYVDVEVPAATEFKFRMDGGWDLNLGGDVKALAQGGDNIKVEPGNYRVYLNLNNPEAYTCSLDTRMYGQEESAGTTTPDEPVVPEEPEKPAYKGWGIVGSAVGSWDVDVPMTSDGTWYVAKQVVLAEGEAKFRLDAAWDTNLGGATFEANKELTLTAGGNNIAVVPGTYDIYLNPTDAKVWFINDGSYPGGAVAPEASEWGVVGVVNGWNAPDITMYKTATEGLFVAYNVAMPDGGFKIRANGEWNDAANYGLAAAGAVEVDHVYDLVCGGGSGDMTLVAGNYDIWFDLTNSKVYIMTPGKPISEAVAGGEVVTPPTPEAQEWFLVGDFNGWKAADPAFQMTLEGDWYVFKGFVANGNGVKLVADANWSVNRGGTFASANEAIALTQAGADILVAAGTYDVYMNADATEVYFMEEGKVPSAPAQPWYLVGDFNGWKAADPAFQMALEGDWYVFKGFVANGNGVKFVADANWSVNRGGAFASANEAIALTQGGADMLVAAGTYDVYMNAEASVAYFMEVGQTPAN